MSIQFRHFSFKERYPSDVNKIQGVISYFFELYTFRSHFEKATDVHRTLATLLFTSKKERKTLNISLSMN